MRVGAASLPWRGFRVVWASARAFREPGMWPVEGGSRFVPQILLPSGRLAALHQRKQAGGGCAGPGVMDLTPAGPGQLPGEAPTSASSLETWSPCQARGRRLEPHPDSQAWGGWGELTHEQTPVHTWARVHTQPRPLHTRDCSTKFQVTAHRAPSGNPNPPPHPESPSWHRFLKSCQQGVFQLWAVWAPRVGEQHLDLRPWLPGQGSPTLGLGSSLEPRGAG